MRCSHYMVLGLAVPDLSQDTLGAPPATEVKLEDHCPFKYGQPHSYSKLILFILLPINSLFFQRYNFLHEYILRDTHNMET